VNLRSSLGENLLLKLVSLGLAMVAWFGVQGERTYQSAIETPVEYLLPPDLVLVANEPPPERVVIVASGTRAALNKLRRASLRYLVDLESVGAGRVVHSFRAPPEGLPQDVSIATVSPAEIELVFDERMTDTFPVQLRTRGDLPTGFVQTEVTIAPDRVRLVGPKRELTELEQVRTLPFPLTGRKGDYEGEVGLDLSKLHVLPETARSVRLTYRVTEAIGARSFGDVAIERTEDLESVGVEPGSCTVTLDGPVPVLEAIARRGLEVRLVGSVDETDWRADGTQRVGWSLDAPESGAAIRVQVLHPRADEVNVTKVDPRRFTIRRPPPPPEDEAGTPTGEEPPGEQ
jgi:hypothetical protein